MKKSLLITSALFAAVFTLKAQTPSFDFQNWTSLIGEQKQPSGWLSENAYTSPLVSSSNPTSVTKDSLSNAHTGYSMKISTVKIATNPLPGTPPTGLPDTVGLAITGSVNFLGGSPSLKIGYKDVLRPSNITFWYKSMPMAGDTCGATITLWQTVSGSKKIVATAEFRTGATTSAMTQTTIPMNYDPVEGWRWADSASIVFGSSYRVGLKHPKIGSMLWVDDIYWGPTQAPAVGIANNTVSAMQVSVYPNPATSFATIETNSTLAEKVNVYDLTGKLVTTELFENGKARINTSQLNAGLYIYSIVAGEKQVLYTQKFNVTK